MTGTGGLAFGFSGIPGPIDISDIIHSFEHDKSYKISFLLFCSYFVVIGSLVYLFYHYHSHIIYFISMIMPETS